MATPNIVGVTTITGFTTNFTATTASTSYVSNANNSNSILKVNLISGSHIAASGTQYLSVGINDLAAGAGTTTWILRNVGIASASSLVVTDKASSFYLTENTSLVVQASAASGVDVTISYDSIR